MAVCQPTLMSLIHRYREQARSHRDAYRSGFCHFSRALPFLAFQLGFVVMGIRLGVEHPHQQVLLVYIPDADTGGNTFVGHVSVIAFSYFHSHLASSNLCYLQQGVCRTLL
jgi:hypothetical protein